MEHASGLASHPQSISHRRQFAGKSTAGRDVGSTENNSMNYSLSNSHERLKKREKVLGAHFTSQD